MAGLGEKSNKERQRERQRERGRKRAVSGWGGGKKGEPTVSSVSILLLVLPRLSPSPPRIFDTYSTPAKVPTLSNVARPSIAFLFLCLSNTHAPTATTVAFPRLLSIDLPGFLHLYDSPRPFPSGI